MNPPRLALARVNYSQLYKVYDGGRTLRRRDVLIPYHLLNLAGYARGQGAEVALFDAEVDLLSEEHLAERILAWKPDVAGLTATTPDIDLTLKTCALIKAGDPAIATVVGGSHARSCAKEIAAHPAVDYVVAGDGEKPLADILAREGARTAPRERGPAGAVLLRGGAQMDLARLPMPAHDLLDYRQYPFTDPTRGRLNTATVMSSRGCPFDCTFCTHDRVVRKRPIKAFLDEIEYLYAEKDVRYFFVYDDTFTIERKRTLAILEGLRGRRLAGAHFQCQVRATLVDDELLEALAATGFVRVSMGIESGSDEMLRRCHKGITTADAVKACRMIERHGIEPRASFILGHPYETRATAEATIRFACELDLLEANFTVMTPYPGTRVYAMALRNEGIRFAQPGYATDWAVYRRWGDPIIATDELSAGDLAELRADAVTAFHTQERVFGFYRTMFENGNRSRYFYRPLNFAWQRRYGEPVPFWNDLEADTVVEPGADGDHA